MKKPAIVLTLAIVGVVVAVESAISAPMIVMTGCDTTSVNGVLRPKVTFRIDNNSPANKIACHLLLLPQEVGASTDTCRALSLGNPSGWASTIRADNGAPIWDTETSGEFCVEPGGSMDGFQVVLSRNGCCFDAYFSNAVPEPYAHDVICFLCDLPTPTGTTSWGQLKVHYR